MPSSPSRPFQTEMQARVDLEGSPNNVQEVSRCPLSVCTASSRASTDCAPPPTLQDATQAAPSEQRGVASRRGSIASRVAQLAKENALGKDGRRASVNTTNKVKEEMFAVLDTENAGSIGKSQFDAVYETILRQVGETRQTKRLNCAQPLRAPTTDL